MTSGETVLFDAGLFIAALLSGDPRHAESYRRVHDARHAATALVAGVARVYTYAVTDWRVFASNGIQVIGPESVLR